MAVSISKDLFLGARAPEENFCTPRRGRAWEQVRNREFFLGARTRQKKVFVLPCSRRRGSELNASNFLLGARAEYKNFRTSTRGRA